MRINIIIVILFFSFNFNIKAQDARNKSLVTLGDSYYMGYGGRFYLDIDTTLTRNGTLDIYYLDKRRFYDLVKEKWVKEHQAIGGNNYNKLYNQVLEFSRTEEFKYIKATKKIKAKAKQLGKEDYITNRDSILTGFVTSKVVVRNAETGKLLYKIEVPLDELQFEEVHKFEHGDAKVKILRIKYINDAFYSPDGKYLITYGYELPLNIYDAKNGKLMKSFSFNKVGKMTYGFRYYRNILKNINSYSRQVFTNDNKYSIFYSKSNNIEYPSYLYAVNDWLFNLDSLKFIKPNITGGSDEQDYFANNYVFKNKNNFDRFNGIQNILDSNNYYKFQCNIDSFKNDEVELMPTYDTNCIVAKSTNYQCLWYYKTNKQVFVNLLVQPKYDSLLTYIKNTKDSALKYFKRNRYQFSAYDSLRVVESLNKYNGINLGTLYISPSTPLLISQNFAENYYKIWDIKYGKLIDSFLNETHILEMQNTMANANQYNYSLTNSYNYIPMAANISTKGKIIWIYEYHGIHEFGGNSHVPGSLKHSFSDKAIKAYHISNTQKAYDLEKMLAYNTDETQMLFMIDSSTAEIKDLLTGATLKTITLKGYNLQAAFYSPQKKSFIGVATTNNNRKLYLYIFSTGKILDLNKPCKNLQVLKPLED
jgi:hypothetical protein